MAPAPAGPAEVSSPPSTVSDSHARRVALNRELSQQQRAADRWLIAGGTGLALGGVAAYGGMLWNVGCTLNQITVSDEGHQGPGRDPCRAATITMWTGAALLVPSGVLIGVGAAKSRRVFDRSLAATATPAQANSLRLARQTREAHAWLITGGVLALPAISTLLVGGLLLADHEDPLSDEAKVPRRLAISGLVLTGVTAAAFGVGAKKMHDAEMGRFSFAASPRFAGVAYTGRF